MILQIINQFLYTKFFITFSQVKRTECMQNYTIAEFWLFFTSFHHHFY